MTFSDLFKNMMIQRQRTWKWYNIQLHLRWPTNKKSYDLAISSVFNDLERRHPYPQFQGHAVFWHWISQKRYDIQTVSMKILIRT